jgi:hypothetical protein
MITINNQLKISIICILVIGYLIYDKKPSLMFKENGEFKHFGLNKDETIMPFFMMIIIVGFTIYYGLLLHEGKYV